MTDATDKRLAHLHPLRYLLLPLALLLSACEQPVESAKTHYHPVIAQPLQAQQSYVARGSFPGRVEAPHRFDIGFEAQGKVTEVNVDQGDRIEEGQVLARLDTRLLEAERDSVIAQRKETQARLKLIGDLKRQQELRRQGFAAEQKIDELLAEQDALRAVLERIAASLVSVDERLDRTVIRAPFTGRIATRFVDPGEVVQIGTPVARLLQGGSVELHVGIPVRLARHLRAGEMKTVIIEGHAIEVPILSVNSAVSPATQTIIVNLLLPEVIKDEVLFDGQIGRLLIEEERQANGVWLPTNALLGSIRGTWNIFVLQSLNNAEDDRTLYEIVRRRVNVLHVQADKTFVEVSFNPNELVVTAGLHRLAPGQAVTLSSNTAESTEELNPSTRRLLSASLEL